MCSNILTLFCWHKNFCQFVRFLWLPLFYRAGSIPVHRHGQHRLGLPDRRAVRRRLPLRQGGPPRLAAGAQAARAHAPRVAGWWDAYSGVWCAFEGAASLARGNEDPWNSVAAGGAAWALLDARQGIRVAARSAVLGAAWGAFIEVALIVFARAFVEAPRWREPPPVPPKDDPALQPPAGHAPTSGGFLGIPRQPIVVQEIAVDDLPSFWRQLN